MHIYYTYWLCNRAFSDIYFRLGFGCGLRISARLRSMLRFMLLHALFSSTPCFLSVHFDVNSRVRNILLCHTCKCWPEPRGPARCTQVIRAAGSGTSGSQVTKAHLWPITHFCQHHCWRQIRAERMDRCLMGLLSLNTAVTYPSTPYPEPACPDPQSNIGQATDAVCVCT